MMESLTAVDTTAIDISLEMVDKADIYVGIFAHRYGFVPEGHERSITEMEYERAVKNGIPRLIFLIHKEVKVSIDDVERGEAAALLDALKERLKKERVVGFFKNPEDLRGQVYESLEKTKLEKANSEAEVLSIAEKSARSLHRQTDIPLPPNPFIAHPYTLSQARGLIGRQDELDTLTDWVTKPSYGAIRIMHVIAIGGMGKSALTWKWFSEIAPQEMPGLKGRLWWSFYESDATFANFVPRALQYVSRMTKEEVKELDIEEQMSRLLTCLDQERHLIVLDGLERILMAYARPDAAYLRDDEVIPDEKAKLR